MYSERTKEKIYVEIKSAGRSPCFRRLNGTHQIGCTCKKYYYNFYLYFALPEILPLIKSLSIAGLAEFCCQSGRVFPIM